MMQQLNHVLAVHGQQGSFVDQIQAGVQHRTQPASASGDHLMQDPGSNAVEQVNLYFNVLLKRVVPLVQDGLSDADGVDDVDQHDMDQHDMDDAPQRRNGAANGIIKSDAEDA